MSLFPFGNSSVWFPFQLNRYFKLQQSPQLDGTMALLRAHKRAAKRLSIISFLISVFALPLLHAQFDIDPSEQVGLKPYGSYHGGDLDLVNMMNGNLTVRIPIVSLPQRGKLNLSFSIVLNNAGYGLYKDGSYKSGFIEEQYYRSSRLGAQLVFDQDLWPNEFYVTTRVGGTVGSYYTNEGFQVMSEDFGRHPVYYDSANSGTLRSTDGSGYLFRPAQPYPTSPTGWPQSDATVSPQFQFDYSWLQEVATGALYTPDGTAYSFTKSTSIGERIQDPDGNAVTVSSSSAGIATPWQSGTATINDTMGRTITSPPAMSNSTAGCPDLSARASNQPLVGSSNWTIPGPNGTTATYTLCYAKVTVFTGFTFDNGYPAGGWSSNVSAGFNGEFTSSTPLLQSIVLPDRATYYAFVYDSAPAGTTTTVAYGDLLQLIFPDGGTVNYSYGTLTDSSAGITHRTRYVQSRTTQANSSSPSYKWQYTVGGTTNPSINAQYPYSSTVQDPDSSYTSYSYTWINDPNTKSATGAFYETNRQIYQGSIAPANLLKGVQTTYNLYSIPGYTSSFNGTTEALPSKQTVTDSANLTASTTFSYDSGFVPMTSICNSSTGSSWTSSQCTSDTSSIRFPFGMPTSSVTTSFSGAIVKQSLTSYLFQTKPAYLSANILWLPSTNTIKDGTNQLSLTSYSYDETGYVSSTTSPLGHVTTKSRWIGGSSYSTDHSWWNANGTLNAAIDPNGVCKSTYSYSSTYAYAFPTSETNCLNQTTSYSYDFNTAQKTIAKDPNQQSTSYTYDDSFGRLTGINYPDGGVTSYVYNDTASPSNVIVNEAITSTLTKSVEIDLDGFGRQISRKLLSDPDPSGKAEVDIAYDGKGQVKSVSNPYRTTTESTFGSTSYTYDALGRKTSRTNPDSSFVFWCYNGIASAAQTNCLSHISATSGEWVDEVDENGSDWQRTTDSLGRLISVIEPNGTSKTPSMETDYAYDVLGNLLQVDQYGGAKGNTQFSDRQRAFKYDGLSRLIAASNPENSSTQNPTVLNCSGASGSWTMCYGYDPNGNLTTRTDHRGATTTYSYDSLNRLIGKSYAAPTLSSVGYAATGPVTYSYDGTGDWWYFPVGRRTGMTDGSGQASWGYDAMGRMVNINRSVTTPISTQSLWSGVTYNLDGSVHSSRSYTGNNYQYVYATSGRMTDVNWMDDSGNPYTLFSGGIYNAAGRLTNFVQGGGNSGTIAITTSVNFDNRLRPALLTAGATAQTIYSHRLCYTNPCGVSGANNGNILQDIDNLNAANTVTYTYDHLNRILSGQAQQGWGDSYSYDPFGNLYNKTPIGNGIGETLQAQPTAQNKLANVGLVYDAAGNVITDNVGTPYTYDGEGRLASAGAWSYSYDGDGRRVLRSSGGNSGYTYWYLPDGTLSERMTVQLNSVTGFPARFQNDVYFNGHVTKVGSFPDASYYVISDQLGSTRVEVDTRWDPTTNTYPSNYTNYYAFGTFANSTDTIDQAFTGKERDTESGNDYFGARYYASSMGRWMSPDWSDAAVPIPFANLSDPQTLNLYGYVRNNPLNIIDAYGHGWFRDFWRGLSNATWRPLVMTVEHPIIMGRFVGSAIAHPIATARSMKSSVVTTATGVIHGNGEDIGVAIGTVGMALIPGAGEAGEAAEGAEDLARIGQAADASEYVNLADETATTHILQGDATGGGHAPGLGIPGKSEFPAGWGNDKIMHNISDVATDPTSSVTTQGRTTIIQGTREGVDIKVVMRDGRIVTGYPTNVPRNP